MINTHSLPLTPILLAQHFITSFLAITSVVRLVFWFFKANDMSAHDELASSFQTTHGDTTTAIAAAFVMINCADSFARPSARNPGKIPKRGGLIYNTHRQPDVALRVLQKK